MNKKFKKFSAMLASVAVLASGMTAINSNAIACINQNKEEHERIVESYNNYEDYTSHPELCESVYKMFFADEEERPVECVDNVWLANSYYMDNPLSRWHIVSFLYMDSLFINIDASDTDLTPEFIENEIKENIDLDGIAKFNVSDNEFEGNYDIYVNFDFSTTNHDENYQKCSQITSFFKKYKLEQAKASIEEYNYERGYYDLEVIDFSKDENDEFILLSDEEVNAINEDFKNNGFNVHLGKLDPPRAENYKDHYYVIFDDVENMTEEEKYEVASYAYEKYGKKPLGYFLGSTSMLDKIDLLNPTGDTNEDGDVTIADAVLIMQALSNPDKYQITTQGTANADTNGDGGVTAADALKIQELLANK